MYATNQIQDIIGFVTDGSVDPATLTYLYKYIICGYVCTRMSELSNCNRDSGSHNGNYLLYHLDRNVFVDY